MKVNLRYLSLIGIILPVLLTGAVLIGSPSANAAKPPIPAGCPGSNQAGPPAPAPSSSKNNNNKTICDTIPAGCPGSSHQGKPKPASECKYAAPGQAGAGGNNGNNGGNGGNNQAGGAGGNAGNNGNAAANGNNQNGTFSTGDNQYKTINDVCGGQVDGRDVSVGLSIKIGCKGQGNPIADAAFAVIRILSNGVGIVIVASLVYAGIQYTGSRGDPQSTAMAVNRIRSSVFALLLFIFGYAILNYLIPAGFLR